MPQYLTVILGEDNFELRFAIRSTYLANLWMDRMRQRQDWPMDNPDRFSGFGTPAQEQKRAIDMIQHCIGTINSHQVVIERPFEYSQDCLNYLHNVFERYHGLLDRQTSLYWQSAPQVVRTALANLNLAVHRAEAALSPPRPEFTCTWFGQPKTHVLAQHVQQQYGTTNIAFGTVYLLYCEIGKTVEDLCRDNDQYIGEEAFKPFGHYSSDFFVAFYDLDLNNMHPRIQNYIESQKMFFDKHHIFNATDVRARALRFPVADLQYTGTPADLIAEIATRQHIQQVIIQ